jgi:hypothetical protein
MVAALVTYTTRAADRRLISNQRRAATRLVGEELNDAASTLGAVLESASRQAQAERGAHTVESALEHRRERSQPSELLAFQLERGLLPELSVEAWEREQPVLALALTTNEWTRVRDAYRRIREMRPIVGELRARHSLPDYRIEGAVTVAVDAINDAQVALIAAEGR